ncbi:hypothetical protein GCK32_015040 [Trichostrongylus colubriformis]|uniref:Hexosyltransferase n=1 Tax=Trichostrongylus colubriformis TaxID=6319 RepID=A0AAN8IHT9_TRICO
MQMEAIISLLSALFQKLREISPQIVLEIGCGSGVVSVFLNKALGGYVTSLATDYNPNALECTMETGRLNEVKIEVLRTDLDNGLDHLEVFTEDDKNAINLNIRFLIEPWVPKDIQLLVMVNSMPDRFDERQMIRTSWAVSDLYDEQNTKVLFLIGKPATLAIEELLAIEEGKFHDIVVADIREDYYSLSLKTYAMLYFKNLRVRSAKCLVKADSDNVLLIRNYERLCEETGPDVAERLMKASHDSWFPHSANYRKLPEDALFTGIFAEKAGIRRKHVGGMSFIDAPEYFCREGKHTYSIHMNRVKDPQRYYQRLISMEGFPCHF